MTRSIPDKTASCSLTALFFAALAGCGGSTGARTDGPILAGGSATGGGGVPNSGGLAGGGMGGTQSNGGTTATGVTTGSGGIAGSGGNTTTGGTRETGGTTATGGKGATGGTIETGGTTATGGKGATGGTIDAGTGCAPGSTLCCGQCLSPLQGVCAPCSTDGGAGEVGATVPFDGATPEDTPAVQDGAKADSGVTADASQPGTYGAGCPTTFPGPGPCSVNGRVCTYGDQALSQCRDKATCSGGQWVLAKGTCSMPAPDGGCPATLAGSACASLGFCSFANGTVCQCVALLAHDLVWLCTPGMNSPACPPTPPNAGTTCSGGGCTYSCGDLSSTSVTVSCGNDGLWQWSEYPCSGTGG
jgi:hypothetical protein